MAAEPLQESVALFDDLSLLLEADTKNDFAIQKLRYKIEALQRSNFSDVNLMTLAMGLDVVQGRFSRVGDHWKNIRRAHASNPQTIHSITFFNAVAFATMAGEAKLAVSILEEVLKVWPLDLDLLWFAGHRYSSLGMALAARDVFRKCAKQSTDEKYQAILKIVERDAECCERAGVSDEECLALTSILFKAIADCGHTNRQIFRRTVCLDQEEPLSVYIEYTAHWMTFDVAAKVWDTYKNILAELPDFPFAILDKISVDVEGYDSETAKVKLFE